MFASKSRPGRGCCRLVLLVLLENGLCDAGGGTTNLISYEITKFSPQLELKELVPSKSGAIGSLNLNKGF